MRPRSRILIVEDDPGNLEVFEQVLQDYGFDTVASRNGEDALHYLESHAREEPAAIMLDLHLPLISGEEFLRRKDRDPSIRDIPVLVVSADTRALEECVAGHAVVRRLAKPFMIDDLIDTLRDTLWGKE